MIAALNILGISYFIPIINQPMGFQYAILFLIVSAYLAIANREYISCNARLLITVLLVATNIFASVSVIGYVKSTNIFNTKYGEVFSFSGIDGPIMGLFDGEELGQHPPSDYMAFLTYSSIVFNSTTVDMYFYQQTPLKLLGRKKDILTDFKRDGGCSNASAISTGLGIRYFITDRFYCSRLSGCGLSMINTTENFCLFEAS